MRLTVVYDGCWSVAYDRITAFWQQQPDVTRDGTAYRYGGCRIEVTPLPDRPLGRWSMPQTQVRFTGDDRDAAVIYRRFFLAFLSAGG